MCCFDGSSRRGTRARATEQPAFRSSAQNAAVLSQTRPITLAQVHTRARVQEEDLPVSGFVSGFAGLPLPVLACRGALFHVLF